MIVHVVSHGPHCLDGLAAAVVVARFYRGERVEPHFSSNATINETLLGLQCEPSQASHEVWITDISWTDPAVDRHLQGLIDRGVKVYWIDHHRTALERFGRGAISVPFTAHVLNEGYAASRLTYEYLRDRGGRANEWFDALAPLVAMADDNDRWLHQIAGAHDLALTVAAMHDTDAYSDLLHIDVELTYTPRMQAAAARVTKEVQRSFQVAESSRVVQPVPAHDLTLISAICDGYASEIADAWGKHARRTVFALFDARSLAVSLRRSSDCSVDLSHLANSLGGGGHPAAAGCNPPELHRRVAEALATLLQGAFERRD